MSRPELAHRLRLAVDEERRASATFRARRAQDTACAVSQAQDVVDALIEQVAAQ